MRVYSGVHDADPPCWRCFWKRKNIHAGAAQVGFFTPGETKWRRRNVAISASRLHVRGFPPRLSRAALVSCVRSAAPLMQVIDIWSIFDCCIECYTPDNDCRAAASLPRLIICCLDASRFKLFSPASTYLTCVSNNNLWSSTTFPFILKSNQLYYCIEMDKKEKI